MPKINRNGQAEVFSDEQLRELFAELIDPHRLIFQICFYTAARISEVVQLERSDIVSGHLVYRRSNTKTKRTRSIRISPALAKLLIASELPASGYLFPGRKGGHITSRAADKALRIACDRLGLEGFSTHSFRRSFLTKLYNQGTNLKIIQRVTGHESLDSLARYLEVDKDEVEKAICSIEI